MKDISQNFRHHWCQKQMWRRQGRSSSAAIGRIMLPWWGFTHVLQIPRKFVQVLPPMLVRRMATN
jgi:hypothetical protein